MNRRTSITFLSLILAQAGHSIEEYCTRVFEVLAPARFISGLLSDDLRTGFIIFNFSLVAFGLWCYLVPFRHRTLLTLALAWFWAVLELFNGSAHLIWASSARAYRPGVFTAPILVGLALALAWQLRHLPASTQRAGA
jgi:hypothetical protein